MENQILSIKHLLSQVAEIRNKYKKIEELTGEKFNIFSILKLATKEVRTHSAFLCELLNPKGSHGYKDLFLTIFLEQQTVKFQENKLFLQRFAAFETGNSIASVEDHLGFIDNDGLDGGRIDLIIKDVKNKAIIIENKIYAVDQPKQLIRYNNAYRDAPIFYLTLSGTPPSNNSSGELKEGEHFVCISYKTDILIWLEKCRKEAVSHSLIRETLTQYINLIKSLTGQTMNVNEKKEIVGQITSNNNYLESFLQIQQPDIVFEVKNYLMDVFLTQVKEIADKNGLKIRSWDSKFKLGQDSDCELSLIEASKFGYYIDFGFLGSFNNLVYGICSDQRPYKDTHRKVLIDRKGNGLVNQKKNEFTNWLWVGKFEEPFVNWNCNEPWLAIQNGTLKDNFNKKIEDLMQIIRCFKD